MLDNSTRKGTVNATFVAPVGTPLASFDSALAYLKTSGLRATAAGFVRDTDSKRSLVMARMEYRVYTVNHGDGFLTDTDCITIEGMNTETYKVERITIHKSNKSGITFADHVITLN